MAEYPTRECGPCKYLGKFDAVAKQQGGDYLHENTIPKPEILNDKHVTLQDHALGVPSTYEHPDLRHPPVPIAHDDCSCSPPKVANASEPPCPETQYSLKENIRGLNEKAGKICPENVTDSRPVNLKVDISALADQAQAAAEQQPQQMSPHQQQPNSPNSSDKPLKGILKNYRDSKVPCPCEEKMGPPDDCTPLNQDPHSKPPVPNELRPVDVSQLGKPPCYLPQPEDQIAIKPEWGNLGPWATGRLDWGPLADLTGTRPIVDKYSITRLSVGEWRTHNKEILDRTHDELHRANLIEFNGRQCLEKTRADTDKNQEDSTTRLKLREQEVFRWKCELERSIGAAMEEIALMESERRRLKSASAVLMLPEAISGECIERRSGRLDPELVRDEVEEELIKEMALTAEIRLTFEKTLKDVEKQLLEDKTAKQRLEYDWSDKKQAHETEVINVALNNKSNMMLFKPGAVRFPDNQSSADHWETFTRETLQESEATRQRSVALRGTLSAILLNAARDLRSQADKVEAALSRRIACTEEIRIRLENDLKKVLQRLADVESIIKDCRDAIRRMDIPMKKAQTRLANRNERPRVENCRDVPQFGLVEEVKMIAENVAALRSQLTQAQESQSKLMKARSDLEKEIMLKRKTLEIDRDRTQLVRTHFPSANALTGNS
ncbi:tektin-4 [Onthophagus taurus]|uniref:tektin-4 n=1 Tax=Onthophagus taurus TaxID=166361 RepID=UPI000C2083B8|nr:tektin-4 [Onthophagus taurus]